MLSGFPGRTAKATELVSIPSYSFWFQSRVDHARVGEGGHVWLEREVDEVGW